MSHDPGDEDDGIIGKLLHAVDLVREEAAYAWFEALASEGKRYATTETMNVASQKFIENWFGKRDNESLGDAMERVANEPNPSLFFNRARNRPEVTMPIDPVSVTAMLVCEADDK